MNSELDSGRLFRLAADSSPVPFALLDREHRFLYVNGSLSQLLGTSADVLVGQPPSLSDTLGGQTGRTYRLHYSPVADESGEVMAIAMVAHDATDCEIAVSRLDVAECVAKVGIWKWDSRTRDFGLSEQLRAILGCAQHCGASCPDGTRGICVVESDGEKFDRFCERSLGADEPMKCDIQVCPGGWQSARWLRLTSTFNPTVTGDVHGIAVDITAEWSRRHETTVDHERFRSTLEGHDAPMAITSLDGRIVSANEAIANMLGYAREELERLSMNDLLLSEDQASRGRLVAQVVSGECDSFVVESRVRCADGVVIWVTRHVTVLREQDGSARELLTQLIDATERHSSEESLRHLVDHDPLTDVLNRRGFDAVLAEHVDHDRRARSDSCLMVIDIDNFKSVNDRNGHTVGDRVLVGLAEILRARLRSTDAIGRLGGDEFVVLLPETELGDARNLAERIADDIKHIRLSDASEIMLEVSASIGVASLADAERVKMSLFDSADRAMYHAKRSSSHVSICTPELRSGGERRIGRR